MPHIKSENGDFAALPHRQYQGEDEGCAEGNVIRSTSDIALDSSTLTHPVESYIDLSQMLHEISSNPLAVKVTGTRQSTTQSSVSNMLEDVFQKHIPIPNGNPSTQSRPYEFKASAASLGQQCPSDVEESIHDLANRVKPKGPITLEFQIWETQKVAYFIRMRLSLMLQTSGKQIAKLWVKGICRKKQCLYPYQNKNRYRETGQNVEIPPWWPSLDLCEFIEPDHVGRFQRINLIMHLLRLRPDTEQLKGWNKGKQDPHPIHKAEGWTAFLRNLAPPAILDEVDPGKKETCQRRKEYLQEIYKVASLEEDYLNGKSDGTEVFKWDVYPEEVATLMGKKGGKKRCRPQEMTDTTEKAADQSTSSNNSAKRVKTTASSGKSSVPPRKDSVNISRHKSSTHVNIPNVLLPRPEPPASSWSTPSSEGSELTEPLYQPPWQQHLPVLYAGCSVAGPAYSSPPVEWSRRSDEIDTWPIAVHEPRGYDYGQTYPMFQPLQINSMTELTQPRLEPTPMAAMLPPIDSAATLPGAVSTYGNFSWSFYNMTPPLFSPPSQHDTSDTNVTTTTAIPGMLSTSEISAKCRPQGDLSTFSTTTASDGSALYSYGGAPAGSSAGLTWPNPSNTHPTSDEDYPNHFNQSTEIVLFKSPSALPSHIIRGFTGHGSGVGGGAAT